MRRRITSRTRRYACSPIMWHLARPRFPVIPIRNRPGPGRPATRIVLLGMLGGTYNARRLVQATRTADWHRSSPGFGAAASESVPVTAKRRQHETICRRTNSISREGHAFRGQALPSGSGRFADRTLCEDAQKTAASQPWSLGHPRDNAKPLRGDEERRSIQRLQPAPISFAATLACGSSLPMVKKPWNWPGNVLYVTGTPASFKRLANSSPSSRSGSAPAVNT